MCAKIATEFRQKFHKPVVIDMFCYRRFGHNEGDEPGVHPTADVPHHQDTSDDDDRSTPSGLPMSGVIGANEVDRMRADWRRRLDAEFEAGQALRSQQSRLVGRPMGRREIGAATFPTTTAAAKPPSTPTG